MRVSKTFVIGSYSKKGTSYKGHKYAIVVYPPITYVPNFYHKNVCLMFDGAVYSSIVQEHINSNYNIRFPKTISNNNNNK